MKGFTHVRVESPCHWVFRPPVTENTCGHLDIWKYHLVLSNDRVISWFYKIDDMRWRFKKLKSKWHVSQSLTPDSLCRTSFHRRDMSALGLFVSLLSTSVSLTVSSDVILWYETYVRQKNRHERCLNSTFQILRMIYSNSKRCAAFSACSSTLCWSRRGTFSPTSTASSSLPWPSLLASW